MPQVLDACMACSLPLGEGRVIFITEAKTTRWNRGRLVPDSIIRIIHRSNPRIRGALHPRCWAFVWDRE